MSDSSPKRFLPPRSQTAHAAFNWPPTDEELAECFYSGPPDEQLAQRGVEVLQEPVSDGTKVKAEPTIPTGPLSPLETSVGPLGVEAPRPATTSAHEIPLKGPEADAFTNTSSKSWDVGFNRPPADSGKSEVRHPEYGGSDDTTTSDIAVFTHEAALDGARKTGWAAEIAHLQALMEALTEKVEWRIPNDTRR